jgi:hypothetical protein
VELLEIHCRGVAIEFCSGCGGVFLDKGEREKLTGVGSDRPSADRRRGISRKVRGVSGGLGGTWVVDEIVVDLAELLVDL